MIASLGHNEYVYCLAAHQDEMVPVWRRIANRPLVIVAEPKSLPEAAIVLCPFHAEVDGEWITQFHKSKCHVMWVREYA